MYLGGESGFQVPSWFLYSGWTPGSYRKNPIMQGSIGSRDKPWESDFLRLVCCHQAQQQNCLPESRKECCNQNGVLKRLWNGVYKIMMLVLLQNSHRVFQELEWIVHMGNLVEEGCSFSPWFPKFFGGQFSFLPQMLQIRLDKTWGATASVKLPLVLLLLIWDLNRASTAARRSGNLWECPFLHAVTLSLLLEGRGFPAPPCQGLNAGTEL